jgi:phage-related protein
MPKNYRPTIKAKFEAILDKIEEYGANLGMPFTRPMGNGLFEIRAKGQAGIGRGFFCAVSQSPYCMYLLKKQKQRPGKNWIWLKNA